MTYILTLWLLWAGGDYRILQVSSFTSLKACASFATNFIETIKADGVVASRWVCKSEEIEDV